MLRNLLLTHHLTHLQAALYALFAFLLFSISDTMGKWLMSQGYHQSTILCATTIPSVTILTLFMAYRHGWRRALYTPYKKLHFLRGITLACITFFTFNALSRLPLMDFYAISFATPMVVTIGAILLFKEKSDIKEWITIIIGFVGILIITNPSYDMNSGYLFAIGAMLGMAAAGLIVRKIGHEEDPYLFVIFGHAGILCANIIPASMVEMPPITLTHIEIFALYAFTIPFAILIMSATYARAPSVSSVAPYQYSQIVLAIIFGYLLFGDIPQINSIIGSLIIIACGLFILFHHKRKRRYELGK
jgi:drug/metabolite transporter (DMT)-like permease